MKRLLAVVVAFGFWFGDPALAFHEQGVANCNGCHLTHGEDAERGLLVGPSVDEGLLIAESASDVCLVCHAENLGAVLGSDPLSPPPERGGGNFVFLFEDNLNDAAGGALDPILGDAAGHNMVAPSVGLSADPRFTLSPGGTFPANQLGCTSCHDPHGNATFRMLNGVGPVMDDVATFANPAPVAVGINLNGPQETSSHHSAYRAGMSEWCGNCHGSYHQGNSGSAFKHRVDGNFGGGASQRFNEYNGDVDPEGGVQATAYLPEVPFEDSSNTTFSTAGPENQSKIMCLSCHRAHATSSPAAGRWDFNVNLLAEDGVESRSYAIPDPYGSPDQGPLCNKCHDRSPGP
ncbi:MAG: cytochrome c3 family protein [Thermoanaerobaculia bacterium]